MSESEKQPDSTVQNLESENLPVIDSVQLHTLIDVIEGKVKRLATFYQSINELVQAEMRDRPELNRYVQSRLKKALTADEVRLIGETALVVFEVVRATPPPPEEIRDLNGERLLRKDVESGMLASGTEDGIYERTEDKNSIYLLLQEDMSNRPALAAYVAKKMSQSVTLEEANLIGKTALVVHNTENSTLSFPIK